MSQQRPEAEAAPVVLRAVTGSGSGSEPHAEAETGSAAIVPMSAAARTASALRHHAGELWTDPGRLLHSLYHGKPGSMAEHMTYLKSAAWVPPEMDGKPRQFLVIAGIAYHVLIAWPLKLAAKAIDSAADRPLRLAALAVFGGVLIFLLAHLI